MDVPGEKAHEEFVAGRADAFLTWEPFGAEGLAKGKGRKLFSTAEALGSTSSVGTVRRDFLNEHPADVGANHARELTQQLESEAHSENYEHTDRTFAALVAETARVHADLAVFAADRA